MLTERASSERLEVLDGWRALSILLVLGCHLLPLGPKFLQLNGTAASMGMALFFTLSGFLITRFLMSEPHVLDFLIRRLFRIVPLAWLGLLVAFAISDATTNQWVRNFSFTANLPPLALTEIASHYWSLCLEVQFYLFVALLFAVLGKRGLYVLPVIAIAITAHRLQAETPVDIVTWRRADEILAGATLALALSHAKASLVLSRAWGNTPAFLLLFGMLLLSSHPSLEALNYARPYFAAALVGCSLHLSDFPGKVILKSPPMLYVAAISYALYVVHQILQYTWLGEGSDRLEIYAKRVPLFIALFALAHVSTFYFERPLIEAGKRFSRTLRGKRAAADAS